MNYYTPFNNYTWRYLEIFCDSLYFCTPIWRKLSGDFDCFYLYSNKMDFAEREYHCPKENQIYPSIPVSGAGSCLFQSFTYFLFNKDISYDLAQNLRMECCYYIINNSQIFSSFIDSPSVEDYVNNLRNPRTFGNHIEIFCISNL